METIEDYLVNLFMLRPEWALPDSSRIYFDMMELPPELITIVIVS